MLNVVVLAMQYDIFSKMVHHNLVSWNTIIAGFGSHGLGERTVELFEQMNAIGIRPDSVTFIGLLTACNHATAKPKPIPSPSPVRNLTWQNQAPASHIPSSQVPTRLNPPTHKPVQPPIV